MAINGDLWILSAYDGSAYRTLVCLTSNGLTSNAEVLETQNKCNPGVISKDYGSVNSSFAFEAELMDDSVGGSNANDASFEWLRNAQASKTKFTARLTNGFTEAGKNTYYATVLVSDLEATAPAGDKSTFSGTLEVDGAISFTNPHGP